MADLTYERALWWRYETIHAVTYFAESCRQAATEAGAKGFWMGYFGFRAAPLGAVSAGVVEATFFNFATPMVQRVVPDVWTHCDPSEMVRVRAAAAAAVLRSIWPGIERVALDVDDLLAPLTGTVHGGGLALYAANRDLTPFDDPVERFWQHTTTLREHRGDAHIAALVANGIDGCEAHLLIAADGGTPGERIRGSRGWTEDEWAAAGERLQSRGLLDADGRLTSAGSETRQRVESVTDWHARRLTSLIDEDGRDRLLTTLHPLAHAVSAAGIIAYPNPIGLSPVV